MPSSASALLKLELQADGENDSTWGSKANDVFKRIEESIAGLTAVVVTGADVTLTDTQFAENQARKMILKATGTLTGNRAIIVPDRTKMYLVDNGTSGAFTLTVKTSGGTGPTIPQGGKSIVYCDATDVIKVIDTDTAVDIINDLTPQLGGILDTNGFDVQFDDATGIEDDSANELLIFQKIASAVNYLEIQNAATGNAPILRAIGDDANVDLVLEAKGTGSINLQDAQLRRPELRDYAETLSALGNVTGATDLDLEVANNFSGTVTGITTFTFSNPPATGKIGSFSLVLTNGGSATVNWPASVDWAGGVAPTLTAAGVDVLSFLTLDGGTTWLGFAGGLDMK